MLLSTIDQPLITRDSGTLHNPALKQTYKSQAKANYYLLILNNNYMLYLSISFYYYLRPSDFHV